jgi:predicted PurR-regulated permease PerM
VTSDAPSDPGAFDKSFVGNVMEAALRLGLLAILLVWSYDIVKPFVIPVLWGAIIAVASMPLTLRVEQLLGGRRTLAAAVVTLAFVGVLLALFTLVANSTIGPARSLASSLSEGHLHVPAPPEGVAGWPLIGESVHEMWSLASTNLRGALEQIQPQLQTAARHLLSAVGGGVTSFLLFLVSLAVAGLFMARADSTGHVMKRLATRIVGEQGEEWALLCAATVRSVLKGVIGVAVIQTVLIAIGLFVMGIPGAGLWSLLILLVAIAQLPPLLVLAPIIAYAFATAETTPAVLFTVWSLLASFSDTFLKPMLMGRGVDIPMPIILLGAIGGMISFGIIGLFAGAVVLAIWYRLFQAWMGGGDAAAAAVGADD